MRLLAAGLALATVAAGTAAGAAAPPRHGEEIGRSAQGRALRAVRIGPADAPTRVLVVGCIHGNECAGTAVTRRLRAIPPPAGTSVWVIDDLNPDGRARGTRQNARGVDLNRNFPRGWRAQGSPGSTYYSGPRPLSEPEAGAVARLIVRIRPAVTVWYHQHLRIVVRTGGDVGLAAPLRAAGGASPAPPAQLPGDGRALAEPPHSWHHRLRGRAPGGPPLRGRGAAPRARGAGPRPAGRRALRRGRAGETSTAAGEGGVGRMGRGGLADNHDREAVIGHPPRPAETPG